MLSDWNSGDFMYQWRLFCKMHSKYLYIQRILILYCDNFGHVCMHIYFVYIYAYIICIHICICVCAHICIYISLYIYIIYTYIYFFLPTDSFQLKCKVQFWHEMVFSEGMLLRFFAPLLEAERCRTELWAARVKSLLCSWSLGCGSRAWQFSWLYAVYWECCGGLKVHVHRPPLHRLNATMATLICRGFVVQSDPDLLCHLSVLYNLIRISESGLVLMTERLYPCTSIAFFFKGHWLGLQKCSSYQNLLPESVIAIPFKILKHPYQHYSGIKK